MASQRLVGMLIPDGTNQFFSRLSQLMQRELQATSRAIVTMDSDGSLRKEQRHLAAFREMGVEGIIFISVGDSYMAYRYLREWGIPVTVMDREIPDIENADFVLAKNADGVTQVVSHLRNLGHRRLGFVKGAENTEPGRVRAEAFFDACAESSIEIPDGLRFSGNFQLDAGLTAADAVAEMPQRSRPTAIFAANDLMAIGLLQRLQERGFRIPTDISVVGFDDIPLASWVYPQLSTVQQDVFAMARVGVQLLQERLGAAGAAEVPKSRIRPIEPRLVVRRSCGPVSLGSV